jgi:hypothetical protein
MFSVVHMKELVKDTYQDTLAVLKAWPYVGSEKKSQMEIMKAMDEWQPHITAIAPDLKLPVVAALAELCWTDLREKIKDKTKLRLMEPLHAPLKKIREFTDPNGVNFPAFEKSDDMMRVLHGIIGFEL